MREKPKRFYWKLPSNTDEMFSPNASKVLYEQYGLFYIVGMIIVFIVLLTPTMFLLSIVPENTTAPHSIEAVLSFFPAILYLVGSMSIGIGLVNILAAVFRQYLGHFVTLICIFGGGLVTALSYWLLTILQL